MIFARAVCADSSGELDLAFERMGLPTPAREYLAERIPQFQVLLTGLSRAEGVLLKSLVDRSNAPGREEYPAFAPGDQRTRPGTALVSGRKDQLERLVALARKEGLEELAVALSLVVEPSSPPPLTLGKRTFRWGERTYVMGVVNVTPDSFSDGGRFLDADAAIAHGQELAQAGADILDVGGESTRPGAAKVSADEELARVLPVIRGLRSRVGEVPISIDTTKAKVAQAALEAGASLVNDISGFQFDPELPRVVAQAKAACCLMHIRGTPETMQKEPRYDDVVEEVLVFLSDAVARAEGQGIPRERILVDPGIGFGKTLGHNLFLLRRLQDLRLLGLPVLVGTSRKSFLGQLTGGKPPTERLAASIGSVAAVAALGGADVVRVHDVSEVRDALAVADAIGHAKDGGALFGRLAERGAGS
ncbi:MAG: dihydropteroate synthase [Myxococcota bacterium]